MSSSAHILALPPGYVLESYRIEHVLGEGGFGITYLALETESEKFVAIKELLPGDIATRIAGSTVVPKGEHLKDAFEWALDCFANEAKSLARLSHPNVVPIHRLFRANGTAYMVMDFVDGQSLKHWMVEHPHPTEAELRGILLSLLDGLEYVHKRELLHRDIKPDNIFLTDEGRPVLLDFGSARVDTGRTQTMTAVVSEGYSPFEQYQSKARQTPATDIYSLAGVMVRAITGATPATAIDRTEDESLQPPVSQTHAGTYSAGFLCGVDAAFAVKAKDRPQTVAQWREMLSGNTVGGRTRTDRVPKATPSREATRPPVAAPAKRKGSSLTPWLAGALFAVAMGAAGFVLLDGGKMTAPGALPSSSGVIASGSPEGQASPIGEAAALGKADPSPAPSMAPPAPTPAPVPAPPPVKLKPAPPGILLVAPKLIARVKETDEAKSKAPVNDSLQNRDCGFIDVTGRWILQPDWEQATLFHEDGRASVKKNGKWGVIDLEGTTVIEPQWEAPLYFSDGFASVKRNGKYGLIDAKGTVILEPQWDESLYFRDGIASVKRSGKYGLIDAKGAVIIEPQWDESLYFSEGFAKVKRNGKYGVVDLKGKVIIPAEWDEAPWKRGSLFEVKRGELSGVIDITGTTISEPDLENFFEGGEGTFRIKRRGKWGFLDATGNVISAAQWDYAQDFQDGVAEVKRNDKCSFIDRQGTLILPFTDFAWYGDGLIAFKRGGKWGYADTKGKTVIEPQWESASRFQEGLAAVRKDYQTKECYINKYGSVVIPPKWDSAGGFREGYATVGLNSAYGFIDRSGTTIAQPQWDLMMDFEKGFFHVKRGEKWGVVDDAGKIVVRPEWDSVYGPRESGLFEVERANKKGIVNRDGNLVLEAEWGSIYQSSDMPGFLELERGEKHGLATAEGKVLAQPEWDSVNVTKDAIKLEKNKKYALMDPATGRITGPKWDESPYFHGAFARVKENQKHGLIDKRGTAVLPAEWDSCYSYVPHKDGPFYYQFIKATASGQALVVWLDPDLKEIWRAELPLAEETE